MNRDTLRQIGIIVTLVITLIGNFLAQQMPIGGVSVQGLANNYNGRLFFLPGNYVFGIWGLIYLGLLAYAIYQALPGQRSNLLLRDISGLFIFTCAMNVLWLVLFLAQQFAWSTVAMVALLVGLVMIYRRLLAARATTSVAERWAVHIPFSIYLGWICVATVANVAYVGVDARWDGFGLDPLLWTAIMMAVAGMLAVLMLAVNRDVALALVVVWALVGIAQRYGDVGTVVGPALVISGVILVALVGTLIMRRGGGQPRTATS